MRNMLSMLRWSRRRRPVVAQRSVAPAGDASMKTPYATQLVRARGQHCLGVVTAALLAGAALGGWAVPTMSTTNAATVGHQAAFNTIRENNAGSAAHDELKHALVGSYVVSGTDPDGRPYAGSGVVDISLAASGALELDWDSGRQVGVAQVIGDVLVVACLTKGRTAILTMAINPDGSLSGKWSRRTDRGQKGTETWKRA
jgi:hypothetical protein